MKGETIYAKIVIENKKFICEKTLKNPMYAKFFNGKVLTQSSPLSTPLIITLFSIESFSEKLFFFFIFAQITTLW